MESRTSIIGKKRLLVVSSVLLSFVLGLPFWLKSTEIYRTPLPFSSIAQQTNHILSSSLVFPCHFHFVLVRQRDESWNETSIVRILQEAVLRISKIIDIAVEEKGFVYGGCGNSYQVMISLDAGETCISVGMPSDFHTWPCGLMESKLYDLIHTDDSDSVDEFLYSFSTGDLINSSENLVQKDSSNGIYTVLSMKSLSHGDGVGTAKANSCTASTAVIGKYRHSWFLTCKDDSLITDEEIRLMSNIVVKFFMKCGIDSHLNGVSMLERGETLPLAADGTAILSFSLLNAEPSDWIFDWNFKDLEARFLEPVIEALGPIASLKVESQVLYHTPSATRSTWDSARKKHLISFDHLPFFVSANEWHLDTSTAAAGRSKVLHFAIYIPPAAEYPLHFTHQDGSISRTNGFTSPGWGGVVILNPKRSHKLLNGSIQHLSLKEMEPVMNVILAQLRSLFGVAAAASSYNKEDFILISATKTGFSQWELDTLLRRRAAADVASFGSTLKSLSHLVQSLPNMVIKDEIGEQVQSSLHAAADAEDKVSLGLYNAAAEAARKARSWAEEAFFQPSIMSLLYLPLEHHFAIYTPFFVPVLLHTILAAFKELRAYRQARRSTSDANTSPLNK